MSIDLQAQLRAALLQNLEGFHRAGVRFVPKIDPALLAPPPVVRGAAVPAAGPSAPPQKPAVIAARPAAVLTPARPASDARPSSALPLFSNVEDSSVARSKQQPRPLPDIPLAPPAGKSLTRSQREEQLAIVCSKVAACRRCQELAETRTQTVFGVGDPEAKIVFVGEAPGADEDKQGVPFVGKAGQLLDKIIAASKLKREEIYICNVLRCRPPGNRTPSPQEAENCWEYLAAQLTIVDPEYIVCWGSAAAQTVLKTKTPIGKMRGSFRDYGRAKVLCTYHPSYLLRNPDAKKYVWDDMKFLMADMGVTL